MFDIWGTQSVLFAEFVLNVYILGPVHTSHFCRVEFNTSNFCRTSFIELIHLCMSVSGKMLQRLRNYPIWRTKIFNGGFSFSEKLLKEGEGRGCQCNSICCIVFSFLLTFAAHNSLSMTPSWIASLSLRMLNTLT